MAGPNSAARSGILPSDRDTVTVKSDTVTFMSYNMTGAETVKCQWVRDLSAEFSVNYCALQEHFKTVKTTGQYFQKQFRDYSSYVIPAHREPGTASGRGKGGLVQLAEKGLAVARARVTSNSPRVQAQVLTFTSFKVLWMNAYLPCYPQLQHYDDTELIQTLSEVERIVAEFSECEVVWAADMNYDTRRDNHFTRTVRPVLQRMGLVSLWEGRNVDHTHVHTDGVSTSIIDHFLVSRPLLALVEDCGPVHRGDNLSRHSPILFSLRLGELPRRPVAVQLPPRRMPAWDSATVEEKAAYTT
jgi:exonuclease III